MPSASDHIANAFGFLPRLTRFAVGLVFLAGIFRGVQAAPRIVDLSQREIEIQLEDQNGPLRTFIREFESAILSGRSEEAEAMVDHEALFEKATGSSVFKDDKEARAIFHDSTFRSWEQRGITQEYRNSRFCFLRARTLGDRGGLLFRSSKPGGAINYALFTLRQTKEGGFLITDVFVVGINEYLSDTIRRSWINVAAGLLGQEGGPSGEVDPEYIANIGAIARMSRDIQDGKPEEVLEVERTLPASVQKARTVMLLRIEAAEQLTWREQDAAYAAWQTVYPDEMDLPLKLVHYYSSRSRWNDAERVLCKLIATLGEDALLKMELGTVLYRRELGAAAFSQQEQ